MAENIGKTDLLTDPGHIRGDLAMIRTAIRRGYDIPDELLAAMPKVAGTIMLDKSQKTANRLKAIETLMAMKESNDKAEGVDRPKTEAAPAAKSQTINVGVSVASVPDTGRGLANIVLARIRANGVSGGNAGVDEDGPGEPD